MADNEERREDEARAEEAEERRSFEQLEGESEEERDLRVLEERYGVSPPRRYMRQESVFDTSVSGGSDVDLARAYPSVAAAPADEEQREALEEAETPAERAEVYAEQKEERLEEGSEGIRRELAEQRAGREGEDPEAAGEETVEAREEERNEEERVAELHREYAEERRELSGPQAGESQGDFEERLKEVDTGQSSVEIEDSQKIDYEEQPEGQLTEIREGLVARGDVELAEELAPEGEESGEPVSPNEPLYESGALSDPREVDDSESAESADEVDATDGAREAASELGVDLSSVSGSGKDGRITKADVEKAAGE